MCLCGQSVCMITWPQCVYVFVPSGCGMSSVWVKCLYGPSVCVCGTNVSWVNCLFAPSPMVEYNVTPLCEFMAKNSHYPPLQIFLNCKDFTNLQFKAKSPAT